MPYVFTGNNPRTSSIIVKKRFEDGDGETSIIYDKKVSRGEDGSTKEYPYSCLVYGEGGELHGNTIHKTWGSCSLEHVDQLFPGKTLESIRVYNRKTSDKIG